MGSEQLQYLHTLSSILIFFVHDSNILLGWLSLGDKPTPLNTLGRKEVIASLFRFSQWVLLSHQDYIQ